MKTGYRAADFLQSFTQKLFFILFGLASFASRPRRFFVPPVDELSAGLTPFFGSGDETPRKSANAATASSCSDPIPAITATSATAPSRRAVGRAKPKREHRRLQKPENQNHFRGPANATRKPS